jgi:hypothetical protein
VWVGLPVAAMPFYTSHRVTAPHGKEAIHLVTHPFRWSWRVRNRLLEQVASEMTTAAANRTSHSGIRYRKSFPGVPALRVIKISGMYGVAIVIQRLVETSRMRKLTPDTRARHPMITRYWPRYHASVRFKSENKLNVSGQVDSSIGRSTR